VFIKTVEAPQSRGLQIVIARSLSVDALGTPTSIAYHPREHNCGERNNDVKG
jgi:hypothetical protein